MLPSSSTARLSIGFDESDNSIVPEQPLSLFLGKTISSYSGNRRSHASRQVGQRFCRAKVSRHCGILPA